MCCPTAAVDISSCRTTAVRRLARQFSVQHPAPSTLSARKGATFTTPLTKTPTEEGRESNRFPNKVNGEPAYVLRGFEINPHPHECPEHSYHTRGVFPLPSARVSIVSRPRQRGPSSWKSTPETLAQFEDHKALL